MEYSIRWTKRAVSRLDEIAEYIALDNPVEATNFVSKLREKIEILKVYRIGKAGRVFGTKELVLHKNYIVVYRVKENEVQILTILHTAQNP